MTLPRTLKLPLAPDQAASTSMPKAIVDSTIAKGYSREGEEVLQSAQYSTIGKMAASIVHDFKGPLTVIRGCAELLANPEINEEKRKRYSDMILEDVNRFLSMSQNLLDYSRGAVNLDPEPVQLDDWLQNLTESIRECIGTVNIRFDTAFNFTGEVEMGESRVRRAVMNIVGNAIDAMPDGGVLTISSETADGQWRLSVTDTGCGIPVDIRTRIFEPFVTRGKEYGTGLGLATAGEIISGHDGSLSFVTQTADEANGTGPGTTFVIEIPVSFSPAPASQ